MPLIHSKSKKAFGENVKREMDAGKPQKQAVAIAYSVKRHAGHKKMSEGGEMKHSDMNAEETKRFMEKGSVGKSEKEEYYHEGGEVDGDDEMYEQCCGELMEALEKKDKRGALQALRAIMMSNRSKD